MTIISADIDGDGVGEMQIQLTGHIALTSGDLIL